MICTVLKIIFFLFKDLVNAAGLWTKSVLVEHKKVLKTEGKTALFEYGRAVCSCNNVFATVKPR